MFQVDDYIVYGGNGVCRILDIGIPGINGTDKKRQYYTLQPIYQNGSTVYAPVDNDKVVVRKLISKEEANELINNIPSIEILLFEDDKMLEEKYKEVMRKYDCKEWIKIIKTSYLRKKKRLAEGKKVEVMDEKYLKKAEEYLFGELAIPLNISKEQVEDFIVKQVKHMLNSEEKDCRMF